MPTIVVIRRIAMAGVTTKTRKPSPTLFQK
jgi:hypothetical protein